MFRPWPADDGALVRIRLVGGRIRLAELRALSSVAATHGDANLHVTGRANLQLRGLPLSDGALPRGILTALLDTGLVPRASHDLVRNVLLSPQTGLAGGRADLRPVAADLDRLICAAPRLAQLPGRFLFVLDDGRGDLVDRSTDLGAVVLDRGTAQLRIGTSGWGDVVALADIAPRLLAHAHAFLDVRGSGPDAPWHVDELPEPWLPTKPRDTRSRIREEALPYGAVPGGLHVGVPDGVLSPALVSQLARIATGTLVVTPWRGVLVPEVRS